MLKKFATRWFGIKNHMEAQRMKYRISLIYAFIGWNTFGILLYTIFKEKMPLDPEERRKSYNKLTSSPGTLQVYQVKGFRITDEIAQKAKLNEETKSDEEEPEAKVETYES